MDYKTAIKEFDSLDNEDLKTKEVYAHFGLTIFIIQLLEQQAINMIAGLRQATGRYTTREEVNALWDDYDLGTRTLGVLINEIKQLYNFKDEDYIEFKNILKLRNYFTHDYFRFNNGLFLSQSGMKRMIKDFIDFQDRARAFDKKLQIYLKVYSDKLGLTPEFIQKLADDLKSEWQNKVIIESHNTIIK